MKITTRIASLLALGTLLAGTPAAFAQGDEANPGATVDEGADLEGTEDAAPQLPPMMLRLRTGGILWGSIIEHDPEWIRFQRVDTNGVVRLPWARLDPAEEESLRLRFGYVEAAVDEIMVTVDRFQLRDGSEVTGLIVNRTEEHIFVKTASKTVPYPKTSIAGSSTIVQVPALDIFTKEELYQQKVLELQSSLLEEGAVGAKANYELAEYCERLFDYTHALHHFQRAFLLDPTYEPELLAVAIARSSVKAEQQDQVDMLAEIDLMRARKRYDLAVALIQEFPTLYPDSPLMEDWNKLRERVAKYQERDLREEVVRLWHFWTVKLTRKAARERKSYEEVLGYLEESLAEELREAVVNDLQRLAPGIQADEMQRFWDEREGGRRRQATYGQGTWLLGEERALAEFEKPKEEVKAEKGSQAEARQKLEERIQRYIKNQELSQKAKSAGDDDEENPQKYWAAWNQAGRQLWTLAYFVEYSGLFRLEKVSFNNCRGCGGIGVREVLFTGSAVSGDKGGSQFFKCTTCYGVARVRRIKYR